MGDRKAIVEMLAGIINEITAHELITFANNLIACAPQSNIAFDTCIQLLENDNKAFFEIAAIS